jgi:hypothetical protein
VYKDNIIVDDIEEQAKSLLDVNPEGDLSREIKDVLDELHIMLNIKSKQQRVLKDFQRHVKFVLAPGLAMAEDIGTARVRTVTSHKISDNQKTASVNGDTGQTEHQGNTGSTGEMTTTERQALKAEKAAKWTMESVVRLFADLNNRVDDLNHLKESAEQTEKAVGCPVSLLNGFNDIEIGGRPSGIEAATGRSGSSARSCQASRRNLTTRAIYYVIYCHYYHLCERLLSEIISQRLTSPQLPLTFGTGIFGMNLQTFGPSWTLHKEITYICLYSLLPTMTGN